MTIPTDKELLLCPLVDYPPFRYINVANSQLSIARHYGGMNVKGEDYTYFPLDDALIRDDVLRWVERERRRITKQEKDDLQIELL